MQTRLVLAALTICIIASILLAGCTQTAPRGNNQTGNIPQVARTAISQGPGISDLIPFVESADAYAADNGKEKALAAFNDKKGPFIRGDLYIFAYDFNGTVLALPYEESATGQNRLNRTGPLGVSDIQALAGAARGGAGFAVYQYENPVKGGAPVSKFSYVRKAGDDWFLGAGIYSVPEFPIPPAHAKAYTSDELVAFVREAADFARMNGKEKAIEAFNNKSGPFTGNDMSISAYDMNGTCLASPSIPWAVGKNMLGYRDSDNVPTVLESRNVAGRGGGFSHSVFALEKSGRILYAPALNYQEPVDSTWWVGAGILNPTYAVLLTQDTPGIRTRSGTKEDLVSFVDDAVRYGQEKGRDSLVASINNRSPWTLRGDLFLFATDMNGTIIGDPNLENIIGLNTADEPDIFGVMGSRMVLDAVGQDYRWTHGFFPNQPKNVTGLEPKLIYARSVDGKYYVGSGLYGVEIQ